MKKILSYLDKSKPVEDRVNILLNILTIEEKATLLKGKDFWTTKSLQNIKLPSFGMTDGPIGVAYFSSMKGYRTRFPATIGLAATWNKKLAYQMGSSMGKEVKLSGRHQLLAPGINIIRSPMCGRNFEYLSEDPILSSDIASELVKGIQSTKVATCVKHYVTNNSETKRTKISTEISERALFEIYIKNFKRVIKISDPWGLMVSYNKINGVYGAENKYILDDILRGQLNFSGHVVTDWGAAGKIKIPANCIKAGLNLEMPGGRMLSNTLSKKNILNALKNNEISESDIDEAVKPLLRTFFRVGLFDEIPQESIKSIDNPKHQQIAQDIAEESMVLLKNEKQILPLNINKLKKIAVIGPNSNKIFGKALEGGSSAVVPPFFITPLEGIKEYAKNKVEIIENVAEADVAILVMGLDNGGHMVKNMIFKPEADTEGVDRRRFELSKKQEKLIQQTSKINTNTIVVLIAGSPIDVSNWHKNVPAILNAWYPGMMGGKALARVLFGDVNPSGKLPVTYPKKLKDHPAHKSAKTFPGNLKTKKIYYDEGIFVGYRHFDKFNVEPRYEFGYGLSYTTFNFSNLKIDTKEFNGKGNFVISLDVENTGQIAGAEVIQVYIEELQSKVERAVKELQGFKKIFLNSQEKKTISISLDITALEYYSEELHKFAVDPGEYKIWIGNSSRNLPLSVNINFI